jgi:hypothetical protein
MMSKGSIPSNLTLPNRHTHTHTHTVTRTPTATNEMTLARLHKAEPCAQRPSRYTACQQLRKTVNAGRRKMEVVGSQQQLEHSSSGNGRNGGEVASGIQHGYQTKALF